MGLIGFLMLGTKGRLAILGIGFLIEKIGIDLDALAKKLGMNEKNTAEWGSATAALKKGFKDLNSFMVDANKQTAEIYDEMNKAAKEAEKMKRNISPFRKEIEKLNEDSLKKLTNLSKQAFEIFDMGIKGMSKGIAESIVLGKEFGDIMKNIGNQILIKIIAALVEVAVKIGVQIALQNITIAQLLVTLGIEKQITREKDAQNKEANKQAKYQFLSLIMGGGMASGGAVSKGKPVMVGERGPELFVPNQTGQITQNARGTGGGSVNVNFNIEAIDSNSFNDVLVENRGIITSIINNALNEKGRRELVSKSISGKKLSRTIDSQRWAFTASIITAKRSDVYGELMSFIIKQRSGKENFTIIPPEIEDARGSETGTVLVNGAQSAGDTTIAMDGFAGDGAGRFKAGDFVKFASHDKVYMVVADVTSSSNAATVTIEPPLIADIANDSTVTYDNVPFTVHLTNDIQSFGAVGSDKDGNLLYKYELDVEETL
jgi:hypothetical protein